MTKKEDQVMAENTSDDMLRFQNVSTLTEHGLMRAIDLLDDILHPTGDQQREINFRLPQLEAALALVQQKELAAVRDASSIQPPTDTDLATAKDLADTLDQLNANSAAIDQVVTTALDLLNAWGNLTGAKA
jgi:hypothetical protein